MSKWIRVLFKDTSFLDFNENNWVESYQDFVGTLVLVMTKKDSPESFVFNWDSVRSVSRGVVEHE